jgi:hypothetical protein
LLGIVFFWAPTAHAAPVSRGGAPKIYIVNACGDQEAVAPKYLKLGCSGAGANFESASKLAYRRYGRATAVASATVNVCLLVAPGQALGRFPTWRGCPEADLSPQESAEAAYHGFAGSFRFSRVVRCKGGGTWHFRDRLFYGEISYSYAGKPWVSRSNLPGESSGDGPRCTRVSHLPA